MVPSAFRRLSCDSAATKLSLMTTAEAFSTLDVRFPSHETSMQAGDRGTSSSPVEALVGSISHGGAVGIPALLLRGEAALVLAGAVGAYAHLHTTWWLFPVLFLVPDLSMLGYAGGRRAAFGATLYNVVHTYTAPALLALAGLAAPWLLPAAAVWVAHIAFDRMLGFGLKYPSAFGDTHLGNHRAPTREPSLS